MDETTWSLTIIDLSSPTHPTVYVFSSREKAVAKALERMDADSPMSKDDMREKRESLNEGLSSVWGNSVYMVEEQPVDYYEADSKYEQDDEEDE